jgi:hypothetical protein
MDSSKLRVRSNDLSWRELDGAVVILDLAASRYLSITGTGAFLWRLLAEGSTVDLLVTAVLEEFDVDAMTARSDVTGFVEDLVGRGLVTLDT